MGNKKLQITLKQPFLEALVEIDGQEHQVIEGLLRGIGVKAIAINSIIFNETSLNKSQLTIYLSDLDMVVFNRNSKELKKPVTYIDHAVLSFKLDEERLLNRIMANNEDEIKKAFKQGYDARDKELAEGLQKALVYAQNNIDRVKELNGDKKDEPAKKNKKSKI